MLDRSRGARRGRSERNRADLDDVPEEVRDEMAFHPVLTIEEVLDLALEKADALAVA